MRPAPFMLFEMRRSYDGDGVLRLSLLGELDLAGAAELESCLRELSSAGTPVRLDLSGLEFTDSTGLRTLITCAEAARRDQWQLEIDRELLPQVHRVIELVGASPYLWPSDDAVAHGA